MVASVASLSSAQAELHSTPVTRVLAALEQPAVLSLRSDAALKDALALLAQNHILSAPVVDVNGRGTVGDYSGCLSVTDVLRALMALLAEKKGANWVAEVALMTESEMQAIAHELLSRPVASVVHAGSLWINTDLDKTSLLKFLVHGFNTAAPHPSHRVYLCGPSNPAVKSSPWTITNVVSQLDMLRYIRSQLPESLASASLHSVGLDIGAAFCVTADTVTLAAFEQMWADHHSSVGVRNQQGELVANLSASDLRSVDELGFSKLLLPVGEFVSLLKGSENSILSVTPESTLGEILDEMVSCGIHRVYIVDKKENFVGIVSATDILKLFSNASL